MTTSTTQQDRPRGAQGDGGKMTAKSGIERLVTLHCAVCRRRAPYLSSRDPALPENVEVIETTGCDLCDRGGFVTETWFDADGAEIPPPTAPESMTKTAPDPGLNPGEARPTGRPKAPAQSADSPGGLNEK
jgi:hypothetical protein